MRACVRVYNIWKYCEIFPIAVDKRGKSCYNISIQKNAYYTLVLIE